MAFLFRAVLLAFLILSGGVASAQDARMVNRVLGDPKAPIKVDEFMSMTCSHCADFTTKTLPLLEESYVKTGKVRFVMHDFPLDGISLKASAIAHCLPEDQFFPFIKTLQSSLMSWAMAPDAEAKIIQYAAWGGLSPDKAKACANDAKMQDALITARTEASTKYSITATPTFIVNDGEEVIHGAVSVETFAKIFDRLLQARKQ